MDCEFKSVGEETKELIKKALLEPSSLWGICRIFGVSLMWLLGFVAALYSRLSAGLGLNLPISGLPGSSACLFTVEADEIWSFVAKKSADSF
jgi:hypothetical protein